MTGFRLQFRHYAAIAAVLFLLSITRLGHLYACLTVAFVLTYLLDPAVRFIERRKISRDVAAAAVLVCFFALIIFLGILLVPMLGSQISTLVERLPSLLNRASHDLGPISVRIFGTNVFDDVFQVVSNLGDPTQYAKPVATIAGRVFTTTIHFVMTVLGLLVIPLMTFYLLKGYPKFFQKFTEVIPKRHHKTLVEIRDRLDEVLGGFLRGQILVSSVLSVYYVVAFLVIGVEPALILGIMAGFFNIVPYLGIVSVISLTAFLGLIHGYTSTMWISATVVFAVGMLGEGSFLTPKIVGERVGLSPLTLILALLVGGELLGLVGMVLSVPLAAFGKVFLDFALARYRNSEVYRKS